MSARQALAQEKSDLHTRTVALMNYIISPKFAMLSPEKQDVLQRQVSAMDELEKVLGERLAMGAQA